MKKLFCLLSLMIGCATFAVQAQVPVTGNPDQESLLQSKDPKLAKNKRLVYDMWREVLEAGHLDLAEKYMAEGYIQHNPLAATGRQGFIDFFTRIGRKPIAIEPKIKRPLVSVVAEGDLVVLGFVNELADPQDATKKYTTTWFDMFRIENGKIAEHWDVATKPQPKAP